MKKDAPRSPHTTRDCPRPIGTWREGDGSVEADSVAEKNKAGSMKWCEQEGERAGSSKNGREAAEKRSESGAYESVHGDNPS
jgi:hypothetical protein